MSSQQLRESILKTLLCQIYQDGRIDDHERQAVKKLFPLLKVSQERLTELMQEARAEATGSPGDGALDPVLFLKEIKPTLEEAYGQRGSESILERMSEALGVAAQSTTTATPPPPEPQAEPTTEEAPARPRLNRMQKVRQQMAGEPERSISLDGALALADKTNLLLYSTLSLALIFALIGCGAITLLKESISFLSVETARAKATAIYYDGDLPYSMHELHFEFPYNGQTIAGHSYDRFGNFSKGQSFDVEFPTDKPHMARHHDEWWGQIDFLGILTLLCIFAYVAVCWIRSFMEFRTLLNTLCKGDAEVSPNGNQITFYYQDDSVEWSDVKGELELAAGEFDARDFSLIATALIHLVGLMLAWVILSLNWLGIVSSPTTWTLLLICGFIAMHVADFF